MGIYGELDPIPENRTQFNFKGKGEHIGKINIPNMAYPNQHINIDIEIPLDWRDRVILPNFVKITFHLDIGSTHKTSSIIINVNCILGKKKVLMLGSKQTEAINNADIYDTYKDPLLSEKERKEKLLQGI